MLYGPESDTYEQLRDAVDPFFLAYALKYGLGLAAVYDYEELAKENEVLDQVRLHS